VTDAAPAAPETVDEENDRQDDACRAKRRGERRYRETVKRKRAASRELQIESAGQGRPHMDQHGRDARCMDERKPFWTVESDKQHGEYQERAVGDAADRLVAG